MVYHKESQHLGLEWPGNNVSDLRCVLEECHDSCVAGGPKKKKQAQSGRADAEVQMSDDKKPKSAR